MDRYQEIAAEFYRNRLLFGSTDHSGIVAVEIGPQKAEIFRRIDGRLTREKYAARSSSSCLGDPSLLSGFGAPHSIDELDGDFTFRYLATFDTVAALEAAKRHLRKAASGGSETPYFVLSDPVEQFLMLAGMTFFVGLEFAHLQRMQIDVQACISPGFEFPSGARDGDRIAAIAITDSNGFERVLMGSEMDEKAMLEQLVAIIRERDPDVIEGHNLFRFGLDYLQARARRHSVALKLGRDGSLMKARSSRMQIAERTIAYRRFDIYGRSLVDTWMLVQHYDISSRELEGFGLEEIERHFRLAHPGRSYIEPERVSDLVANEPAAAARCDPGQRAPGCEVGRDIIAQLLRPGADLSLLVSERDPARERDQDRLAVAARLPGPGPQRAVSRTADRVRRRIHRGAAAGRGPSGGCIATSPRSTPR